jgi:predicted nucleic acid-binding protein
MILGKEVPRFLVLIRVNEYAFKESWGIFKKTDRKLSFTDCTTVALSKIYGTDSVMSFDSDLTDSCTGYHDNCIDQVQVIQKTS